MRSSECPVSKILGKLLNNALYGRLGVEGHSTQTHVTKDKNTIPSSATFRICGPYYLYDITKTSKKKRNVAIAAAITAKARIILYQAMFILKRNGGRILYCDTDAIV